ncbi:MAG: hypothetical protein JXB32_19130 [Deltaproteobacteria bacterium]|nr:hypothetical protein [Deltaproteobacteria bacterium]
MEGPAFDEGDLFRAIAASGARALLIGRRAMVAYGLPVLTADYDLWIDPDDVEALNAALAPLGLRPTRPPDEARRAGRYVLENDEHVDVLLARHGRPVDGATLAHADAWARRKLLRWDDATAVAVPSLDDLILTKRWAGRDKDVADLRLLEALRRRTGGGP